MRALRDSPFPFETVRDLLGILRVMYAVTRQQDGGERSLQRIAQLGRELRVAIELAGRHPPGSLGFTAAWERAESAVQQLGNLVDCTTPLEPALKLAGERVTRSARHKSERELRRHAVRQ